MSTATLDAPAIGTASQSLDEMARDAVADYRRLIVSIVEGKDVPTATVREIVTAAGKSLDNLQANVARATARKAAIEGFAKANSLEAKKPELLAAENKALADLEAAIQAANETVRPFREAYDNACSARLYLHDNWRDAYDHARNQLQLTEPKSNEAHIESLRREASDLQRSAMGFTDSVNTREAQEARENLPGLQQQVARLEQSIRNQSNDGALKDQLSAAQRKLSGCQAIIKRSDAAMAEANARNGRASELHAEIERIVQQLNTDWRGFDLVD